jgi:periplasmic mercuric ion binding protein
MKRNSVVLAFVGLAGLTVFAPAHADDKTVTLSVPGMYCEICPATVSKALKKVNGVEKVAASFETKEAVVTFDDARTSVAALRKATANAGYPSVVKQ